MVLVMGTFVSNTQSVFIHPASRGTRSRTSGGAAPGYHGRRRGLDGPSATASGSAGILPSWWWLWPIHTGLVRSGVSPASPGLDEEGGSRHIASVGYFAGGGWRWWGGVGWGGEY